jgi:hypothetical protein
VVGDGADGRAPAGSDRGGKKWVAWGRVGHVRWLGRRPANAWPKK